MRINNFQKIDELVCKQPLKLFPVKLLLIKLDRIIIKIYMQPKEIYFKDQYF